MRCRVLLRNLTAFVILEHFTLQETADKFLVLALLAQRHLEFFLFNDSGTNRRLVQFKARCVAVVVDILI